MRDDFDRVLPLLFADEGGYCNDAGDPGGPTKFGIIYADLVTWRGAPAKCAAPDRIRAVQAVTKDEAAAIYKARYWDSLRCSELPAGVDYAVFDYGVNSGISRAAKVLQRIVGAKPDGIVGGLTLAAVARMDPVKIIDALSEQRLGFLQGLKTWRLFGRGWKARVVHVHADAIALWKAGLKDVTPSGVPAVSVAVKADAQPALDALTPATAPFVVPTIDPPSISAALQGDA